MKLLVKSALAGAALIIADACATPVEIEGDVFPVDPSAFGDAGVAAAGAGGVGSAGTGAGGSGVLAGGTGLGSGASGGSAMQATAGTSGLPVSAGGAGAGLGGAASLAGAGGTSAGGAAGAAVAGAAGAAGTGAASVFDPAACNFEDVTGCEDSSCQAQCPTNDGGSCNMRCQTLITCVTTDPACTISEADPLCAARINGTPTACTEEADTAGGANTTQATQPAFMARQYVECICSVPRP